MDNGSDIFTIANVSWKGHLKRVRLDPGGRLLDIPLSSCVSKGDKIAINPAGAWVICKNGHAQFLAPYVARETLHLGAGEFR